MGSYVFRWEKPGAHNVFVTGDFDNWSKSVELKKENGIFEKQVDLPLGKDLIHFKFVVDGSWVIDESLPTDKDSSGNTNNVLRAEDLNVIPAGGRSHSATHDAPTPAAAAVSGAALGGAAAAGAGVLAATSVPGAFPETPGANGTSITPPLNIYPGDEVPDYSTYNAATASPRSRFLPSETHAKEPQEKEQTFAVNPLPASEGTGNPIKVAAGDPLPKPSEVSANTVGSHVTTDQESYEKSDRYPTGPASTWDGKFGVAPYMGGPHVEGANQPKTLTGDIAGGLAAAAAAVGLGGVAGAIASSAGPNTTTSQLAGEQPIEPRGGQDPTIKSAAGQNTSTAQLASQVPLEPRGVPQTVSDSQHIANASPEASSNAGALADKEKLEQELKAKVPEEPATSEDNISKKAIAGAAAGTAAVGAGVAAVSSNLPSSIQNAISSINLNSDKNNVQDGNATSSGAAPAQTASGVPQEVQESINKAHASPEAAANPTAVAEKQQLEAELKSHIPKTDEAADATPATSAALSPVGPTAESSTGLASSSAGPTIADENTIAAITMANNAAPPATDSGVATPVVTSAPGNAAAAAAAAREAESSSGSGLNASAEQPAQSIATETKQLASQPEQPSKGGLGVADGKVAVAEGRSDSRDVSPMSRPAQPSVTTGVNTTTTPVKSAVVAGNLGSPATPVVPSSAAASSTPSTTDTKSEKKDKRRSLFGRIKDKLKN